MGVTREDLSSSFDANNRVVEDSTWQQSETAREERINRRRVQCDRRHKLRTIQPERRNEERRLAQYSYSLTAKTTSSGKLLGRPGQSGSENLERVADVMSGLYKQETCPFPEQFLRSRVEVEPRKGLTDNSDAVNAPCDISRPGNKIIAIGGAKGGIGKSLIASNLAVTLANKGYKTLIVDLDLGAPNLHLYFGETALDRYINDFINNSFSDIEELVIKTSFGPYFLGGKTAQLGAANISFTQKLKLIRAIRRLDADYVILDLAGGTHYNIIDFFLAADHRIVITTSDPASYLDAYNFIKVSLYRKLNRLFGRESSVQLNNKPLQRLLQAATTPNNRDFIKTIGELYEQLEKELPQSLPLTKQLVDEFTPHLVMNKITEDVCTMHLFNRIQRVADQMLHLDLNNLGSIPYHTEAEYSTRELIPVVAKYPNGIVSKRLNEIAECL